MCCLKFNCNLNVIILKKSFGVLLIGLNRIYLLIEIMIFTYGILYISNNIEYI